MSSPAASQPLPPSTRLRRKAARSRLSPCWWIARRAGARRSRRWGIGSLRCSPRTNCWEDMPDQIEERIARLGEPESIQLLTDHEFVSCYKADGKSQGLYTIDEEG